MSANGDLEGRVRRLEDRAAIQDLGILYGFVMDERHRRSAPDLHR